jgi:hypothetical protein
VIGGIAAIAFALRVQSAIPAETTSAQPPRENAGPLAVEISVLPGPALQVLLVGQREPLVLVPRRLFLGNSLVVEIKDSKGNLVPFRGETYIPSNVRPADFLRLYRGEMFGVRIPLTSPDGYQLQAGETYTCTASYMAFEWKWLSERDRKRVRSGCPGCTIVEAPVASPVLQIQLPAADAVTKPREN